MASTTLKPLTTKTLSAAPDILAYRLGDKLVYVTPADDYEQALDYAYSEFPEELYGIPRERVRFFVNVQGSRKSRIGQMAWKIVVSGLKRYDIVDIEVQYDEQPPHYNVDSMDEKTGLRVLSDPKDRSRSSSPGSTGLRKGAKEWIERHL